MTGNVFRYKYSLHLFSVMRHTTEGLQRRAAALLTPKSDIPFSPKFTDIQVFSSGDALMSWLIGTGLLEYEGFATLYQDFKTCQTGTVELHISPLDAAKLVPPLNHVPGDIIPSENWLAKIASLKTRQAQEGIPSSGSAT